MTDTVALGASPHEVIVLDLDWELLSHLAIPESLGHLRAEQFSADLIEDSLVKEVFDWQMSHQREHGIPASASVLEDQFPDISIESPQAAIGDLIDRIRGRYMRNKGRAAAKRIALAVVEQPLEAPKIMLQAGRELSDLVTRRGEVFGSGDFHRLMALYNKRALVGPGPSLGFAELDEHFNGMLGITFLIGAPKSGKALALDTPIATPTGWSTMADLKVGDQVFDENGLRVNVTWKSPVYTDHPCYRVTFADGESLIADAGHQWFTNTRTRGGYIPGIRTTEDLAATVTDRTGRRLHSIPVAGPLDCEPATLPVDPYVLGIWLGDGTCREASITTSDDEVITAINAAGYSTTKWASAQYGYTVHGLSSGLKTLDLMNNKHIPDVYLRASRHQRLTLLQGLLDSDGECTKKGDAVFSNTNRRLSEDVLELVLSLGFKAHMRDRVARLNGISHGTSYSVCFTAHSGFPLFRLTRKRERQRASYEKRLRSMHRVIASVERIDTLPVQCISVDGPSHLYLAGRSMIPTHNSWNGVNCVRTNVITGRFPYVYSLELPAEEYTQRLIHMTADVPYWKFLKTAYMEDDRQRLKAASEFLDERGQYRVEKPQAGDRGVQRMVERALNVGADCVIIDQLQYVETRKGVNLGSANNTGDYWEVCNDLRDYSDQIPIYIIHQFNRSVLNSKELPEAQQAKGSAAVEEVATLALGIWADTEMRKAGVVELGTLASRNYSYKSWQLGMNMSCNCSLDMLGPVDEDEA